MVTIKKCQSKKHNFGGCGDPKCPEGLSIQKAVETAAKDGNISAYFTARQLQDKNNKSLYISNGIASLFIESSIYKFVASRPEVVKEINSYDRSTIPSFNSYEDLKEHLGSYRPYAYAMVQKYDGYGPDGNITRLSVGTMEVDADLRGMGLGSYFRKVISKYADENSYILSGTPTNSGDGTMDHNDDNTEQFRQHALDHRARLEHFYLRTGYEHNYGTMPSVHSQKDYLTNKPTPHDAKWYAKFNEYGQNLLADAGSYIRWPNNTIPPELLK
jgi:GNAT superfamily N-acetyltransferase